MTQLIKRAVVGGYVQADTTGTGTWEVGRITKVEQNFITFESTADGQEVRIGRADAYKATKKEYEDSKGKEDTSPAQEEADLESEIDSVGLTDLEDADMADLDDNEVEKQGGSIVKEKYRQRYVNTKIDGRSTKICGDDVSWTLASQDLATAYRTVATHLELDPEELKEKYGHLNNGQQKMVLSNRLRAYLKKQVKSEEAKLYESEE